MTKSVKFDENGRRSEIEIQIFGLNTQGGTMIGTWDPVDGIKKILSSSPDVIEGDPVALSLRNRTFIVLTALVTIFNFHFHVSYCKRGFQCSSFDDDLLIFYKFLV